MDTMNERLRSARMAAGFSSAMSAAKKFGWGTSTYAAHENGQNGFDPEAALKYARAYKVTASWLLTAEGDPPEAVRRKAGDRAPLIRSFDPDTPDPAETSDADGAGSDARKTFPPEAIPELVARGGMGTGQVISSVQAGEIQVDEIKDDYWRFPFEFARATLGAAPIHLIVVACSGDSMEPTLSSGERVWVNTSHRQPSPDGIYAIRDIFEGVIVKRLEIVRGDPPRLRIISDNSSLHRAQEVGLDEVNIIGKVVCALRLF